MRLLLSSAVTSSIRYRSSFTYTVLRSNDILRHFLSTTNDNEDKPPNRDRVRGSMDNFLRQAKNKKTVVDHTPWSKLLSTTEDPILKQQEERNEKQQLANETKAKKAADPSLPFIHGPFTDEEDMPSGSEIFAATRELEEIVFEDENYPSEPESESEEPISEELQRENEEFLVDLEELAANDEDEEIQLVASKGHSGPIDKEQEEEERRENLEAMEYESNERRGRRRGEDSEDEAMRESLMAEVLKQAMGEKPREVVEEKPREEITEFEGELGILNQYERFEKMGRKGLRFNYEGEKEIDDFDEWIGDIFQESVKTSTGVVWGTIELESEVKRKRIRIPHPRSTKQLVRSCTPQIRSSPPGTYGYQLATEAWVELSKNPFWTHEMKADGCNYIAKEVDKILNYQPWELSPKELEAFTAPADEENPRRISFPKDVDHKGQPVDVWWPKQLIERELTFDSNFHPGPDAIELERIEEQKRLDEAQRLYHMTAKQESTDWSVQAVVDEDDLFK